MRITIDNQDGHGAVDYTDYVTADGPITIFRALNQPSRCTAEMLVGLHGVVTPVRRGRVIVSSDAGTQLFTGYLAVEPVLLYSGFGVTGAAYKAKLTALSDEWLLDKQGSGASAASDGLAVATSGGNVVAQLTESAQATQSVSGTGLTVTTVTNPRAIGAFAVEPSASWSTNAGAAANATYATYRVLNGTVSVAPAGAVVHAFTDADGTLNLADLSTSHVRELANDVTISGAEEATAYVQEIFQGDGTTTEFTLSNAVFRGSNRTLLRDSFTGASFDLSQWVVSGAANHLQLTSAGLTLNGGNGFDGQTTLTAVNAIEMSGFVLAELGGVNFGAASDGVLAGFYNGPTAMTDCFAGFRVRQSTSTTGGVTVVVPMVNGAEQGQVFTPTPGHSYTVRLRLYCVEMQRVPQRYYCMVDGAVQEFGSTDGVAAPMQMVFEVVDEGASSNTPATVLFDTAAVGAPITDTPASCSFVAANSVSLYGSVASVEVTRPGSAWVVSTLPNGAVATRLIGAAGEGADCRVSYGTTAGSPGKVTFFAGRIPVASEKMTVYYRLQQTSVARVADAASIATEAAAGVGVQVPGVSRWLGRVIAPAARSSADCQAAAQAVLAMTTARSAALGGTYKLLNPAQDIWPGDLVQITNAGASISLLVRSVEMRDGHAASEIVYYELKLANDWATEWADGLGLKLSDSIASGAVLPNAAAAGPNVNAASLQQMSAIALTGSAIQIDAGLSAPSGGGFEVRRRDWNFGIGVDTPDLVLRSPVRSFSIPRAAQTEQFYVRMYDGSSPPLYSEFSSVLFVNWPVS